MADAAEFVAPLISSLLPVPATQGGICAVCHSSSGTYPECYQCKEAATLLGPLDSVLPIALTTSDRPLYEALRGYKDGPNRRRSAATPDDLCSAPRNVRSRSRVVHRSVRLRHCHSVA